MIEGSVVGYASLFFCYSFLVLVPVVVTVIVLLRMLPWVSAVYSPFLIALPIGCCAIVSS